MKGHCLSQRDIVKLGKRFCVTISYIHTNINYFEVLYYNL